MARLENKKKAPMSATERKARQQLQNDQKLSTDMAAEAEVDFAWDDSFSAKFKRSKRFITWCKIKYGGLF